MSTPSSTRPLQRITLACPFCSTLNRIDAARARDRPKCGECGKPILLDRPVKVGDNDLERVVKESDIPIVVDFYADWCGPCKAMAPVLDDVASRYTGRVLVGKLDTDRNPTMAVHYAIRGIPTLIVFRGGREYRRQVGAVSRADLERLLDEAIAADI
ncbi:MAG TPA: thioredoxin TrxC [Longimicrobiales bacterium]|nr:thioredoxin TrxC [Longimicrobiales bacterium]